MGETSSHNIVGETPHMVLDVDNSSDFGVYI